MRIRLLLSSAARDRISPGHTQFRQGIFGASACPLFSGNRKCRVTWASLWFAFPFGIEPRDQKWDFPPFYWNALIPYMVRSAIRLEFSPQCPCRVNSSVRMGAWHTWGMQLMHWEIAQQMQMWTTSRLVVIWQNHQDCSKITGSALKANKLPLYC